MKNKILLQVFIPISGESYEFLVPIKYNMAYVSKLIVDYFRKRPAKGYIPSENSILCDRKTGRIYSSGLGMEQYALLGAPELMLI